MRKRLLLPVLAGALVSSTAIATETITYTYDAHGRLVKSSSSGSVNNNQVRTVCYDAAGNRVVYKSSSTGQAATCLTTG